MSREGESGDARLDRALAGLPRELRRRATCGPRSPRSSSRGVRRARWLPLAAAAVLLVVSSSLITARCRARGAPHRRRRSRRLRRPQRPTPPAACARHLSARATRSTRVRRRRAAARRACSRRASDRLPSSARQKVEDNLAELQRAADEINAALALQPGDALLEELLLNTYQDELAVLASVNQLANLNGTVVPEDEGIKL